MADLTDADLDAIEARLNAAGLNPSADTTIGVAAATYRFVAKGFLLEVHDLIAAIDDPDGGKSLRRRYCLKTGHRPGRGAW